MQIKRIIVGSPIRQKPQVLKEFLKGLDEADKDGLEVSYFFVDDNVDPVSSKLISEFASSHRVINKTGDDLIGLVKKNDYISNEHKHFWNADLIRKVAFFKDCIIQYAVENDFDYLFFIDSDIVIDRRTLQHLISRNVEIVSNVFWTQWQPNWELEPQCFWIPDLMPKSDKPFTGTTSLSEKRQLRRDFFAKLRIPGLYKVDGLGACTMISKSALKKGVCFKEIPNLSVLGEDRHFCIRAGVLGIDLYFDTVYPVYHIYREAYLNRVEEYKSEGFKYDMCQTYEESPKPQKKRPMEFNRLCQKTAKYVRRIADRTVLRKSSQKLVYHVNLDGGKIALLMVINNDVDDTVVLRALDSVSDCVDYYFLAVQSEEKQKVCEQFLKGKQYWIITFDRNASRNQYAALWKKAEQRKPGWIMCLNGNEVVEKEAAQKIRYLVANKAINSYWFKRKRKNPSMEIESQPYLMRWQQGYDFKWNEHDSGLRFPIEVKSISYANIDFVVEEIC